MTIPRLAAVGLTSLCACLVSEPRAHGQHTFRVLALSGQQAPGAPEGVVWGSLASPAGPSLSVVLLNDAGQAAVFARLAGAPLTYGVFAPDASGTLAMVARSGDQAFGFPEGAVYQFALSSVTNPLFGFNDDGIVGFAGSASGGGVPSTDFVILGSGEDGPSQLFREGDPVEGLAGVRLGSPIQGQSMVSPRLSDSGRVAFVASLTGEGATAGVDDLALVSSSGALLAVRLRRGDPLPGSSGVTVDGFAPLLEFIASGQIAINAVHTDVVPGNDWSEAVIEGGDDGAFQTLARSGQSAPGFVEPPEYEGDYAYGGFVSVRSNASGSVAYLVGVSAPGLPSHQGIYVWDSGALQRRVTTEDDAPGVGGDVRISGGFSPLQFNDQDQLAFIASLAGEGVNSGNDTALFGVSGASQLTAIAREGDQAPGLAGGVLLSGFFGNSGIRLNDTGQTAWVGGLSGGGRAVFLSSPDGGTIPIIATGQTIDVGVGALREDVRTVASIGSRIDLNDAGQVAFDVRFTDGSSAIVLASPAGGCPGDTNGDNAVDFTDLNAVLAGFGQTGPGLPGDVDGDGGVDFSDLNAVLAAFGEVCG